MVSSGLTHFLAHYFISGCAESVYSYSICQTHPFILTAKSEAKAKREGNRRRFKNMFQTSAIGDLHAQILSVSLLQFSRLYITLLKIFFSVPEREVKLRVGKSSQYHYGRYEGRYVFYWGGGVGVGRGFGGEGP